MFCVKCGTALPDDANFCFKCGYDLRNLNQKSGMDKFAIKCVKHPTVKPMQVNVGEYVKFGSYHQNNDSTKEPIEWLVLEVNGDESFLISRYGLDCQPYNREYTDNTWEQCDLRRWLNGEFLKAAFSPEEQRRIKLAEVVNDDTPDYGTRGGNNTRDHVFCLSLAEAESYFNNNSERRCRPTALAKAHGAYVSNDCCFWWLRSPGTGQSCASCVLTVGALNPYGNGVLNVNGAVRPALRLIWNL